MLDEVQKILLRFPPGVVPLDLALRAEGQQLISFLSAFKKMKNGARKKRQVPNAPGDVEFYRFLVGLAPEQVPSKLKDVWLEPTDKYQKTVPWRLCHDIFSEGGFDVGEDLAKALAEYLRIFLCLKGHTRYPTKSHINIEPTRIRETDFPSKPFLRSLHRHKVLEVGKGALTKINQYIYGRAETISFVCGRLLKCIRRKRLREYHVSFVLRLLETPFLSNAIN